LAGGRGLRMDNLDDAVVKLLGFRDLDRTCLFGNA
jgi:GTP:adenosylcobinamide-phosphate guanylyltransferase